MQRSAIRKLSASRESAKIAAALFEKTVQIWDLVAREKLIEFETVFSFGGSRLALDALGQKCVAAAWTKGKRAGVACYEADTGKLIWHRQDLRHTQRVRFSSTHRGVWCVPDSGPTRLLASDDGRDYDSIVGLEDIYDSDYSNDLLLEKRKHDYILKNEKPRRIPRLTFAILDAAFGTQSVAISESRGPVRCIDSFTAAELWRFSPPKDSHVLNLWLRKADQHFYGVLWNYMKGSTRYLIRLNPNNGASTILCSLDSWEEIYCSKLDCVVTSAGEMITLSQGNILHRLQFPLKDYPH